MNKYYPNLRQCTFCRKDYKFNQVDTLDCCGSQDALCYHCLNNAYYYECKVCRRGFSEAELKFKARGNYFAWNDNKSEQYKAYEGQRNFFSAKFQFGNNNPQQYYQDFQQPNPGTHNEYGRKSYKEGMNEHFMKKNFNPAAAYANNKDFFQVNFGNKEESGAYRYEQNEPPFFSFTNPYPMTPHPMTPNHQMRPPGFENVKPPPMENFRPPPRDNIRQPPMDHLETYRSLPAEHFRPPPYENRGPAPLEIETTMKMEIEQKFFSNFMSLGPSDESDNDPLNFYRVNPTAFQPNIYTSYSIPEGNFSLKTNQFERNEARFGQYPVWSSNRQETKSFQNQIRRKTPVKYPQVAAFSPFDRNPPIKTFQLPSSWNTQNEIQVMESIKDSGVLNNILSLTSPNDDIKEKHKIQKKLDFNTPRK